MLTNGQLFLVALFTLALLYGVYLATLIQCFRWLVFADEGWKLRAKINSVMTLATIFIFLTSTINVVSTLKYELDAYVRKDQNWSLYGVVMVADISWLIARLLIDGVLIYRCWIVYARSWRAICVPVAFWLASLACSILLAYYTGLNYKRQTYSAEIALIESKAITGLYGCNIATTVYSTAAIIYRIWSAARNSGGSPRRLIYTMRILAESGILYTSTSVFSLVGTLLIGRSDRTWIDLLISDLSDAISLSMASISFNLILIRVYQSRVEVQDMYRSADSGNADEVRKSIQ
ncbi:hypothetical protein M378DRAFT_168341 [Amanita muscaria Koide BX008]|uniref:Uncharacterized protein n=1 Tax=Amanita muscaria (strain Koide BX008) TaxID=946122 RepID=A0A0C2T181_AMAMK|nr:hypothetical protein M378DRAFT_168341 [Amanita muscaria Koide BX008]